MSKGQLDQERQDLKDRAKAEAESKQERSAGELALLFMGINQVAFELLIENPMTGFMNEVCYTRILGHDDIEQGNYWADSMQCYICQRWEKIQVKFDLRVDVSAWTHKITQFNYLKKTVEGLNNESIKAEIVDLQK